MRKITVLCAAAILASCISPLSAGAAVLNTSTGVLTWDFETADQVAPPPKNEGKEDYEVGAWKSQTALQDNINSGAWSVLQPSAGEANVPVFIESINNVWTKGSSKEDWVSTSRVTYYPTSVSGKTTIPTENKKVFEASEIADKGNNVLAAITSREQWSVRMLGACIKLSDKDVIPGQSYTLSLDLYYSSAREYSSNNAAAVAGFGKPSDRENATYFKEPNQSSNVVDIAGKGMHGNSKGKGGEYDTVYEAADIYAGGDSTYGTSPQNLNMGTVMIPRLYTGEGWKKDTITITPKASDFENGEVILYVGVMDSTAKTSATAYLYGGDMLFMDNITLTPTSSVVGQKAAIGGYWDFEDNTAQDWVTRGSGWTGAMSTNSATDDIVNTYGGRTGRAPTGSKVLQHQAFDNGHFSVMSITLDKSQFPAGTYTLSFKVIDGDGTRNNQVNAAVFAGDWFASNTITTVNNSSIGNTSFSTFEGAASNKKVLGYTGCWWSTLSGKIEIEETDYVNNKVTLALYFLPCENFIRNAARSTGWPYYNSDKCTYLDDISFTLDTPASGTTVGNHQVVSTVTSYGATKSFLPIVAEYTDETEAAFKNITILNTISNVGGTKISKFNVTGAGGGTFKFFNWGTQDGGASSSATTYVK